MTTPLEHKIFTEQDKLNPDRSFWECSCGVGGSCPSYKVDLVSDKHIDYESGETRIDTNKPF